jgi:hypothetical protein
LFLRRSAQHRRKAGSLHRGVCGCESNCNSISLTIVQLQVQVCHGRQKRSLTICSLSLGKAQPSQTG